MYIPSEVKETYEKRKAEQKEGICQKLLKKELERMYPEEDWTTEQMKLFDNNGKELLNCFGMVAVRKECHMGVKYESQTSLLVEMKNKLLIYIPDDKLYHVIIMRPTSGIIIRNHCPCNGIDRHLFENDIGALVSKFKQYLQGI